MQSIFFNGKFNSLMCTLRAKTCQAGAAKAMETRMLNALMDDACRIEAERKAMVNTEIKINEALLERPTYRAAVRDEIFRKLLKGI